MEGVAELSSFSGVHKEGEDPQQEEKMWAGRDCRAAGAQGPCRMCQGLEPLAEGRALGTLSTIY